MVVRIKLPPDVEAYYVARARDMGLSMEDYIRNRLVAEAPSVPPLTPEERAAAFRAWADSHEPSGAPLSDEAISRESIYGERR